MRWEMGKRGGAGITEMMRRELTGTRVRYVM